MELNAEAAEERRETPKGLPDNRHTILLDFARVLRLDAVSELVLSF